MAMGKGKLAAERLRAFSRNRWLVLVAAMWVQSMAGTSYLFGAISPVLKASLGYDQRQVAALAVAKNLGGYVGVVSGTLSAALPAWAMLLMGAAQNIVGYGWLWLIVTAHAPPLHLWMMCVLIFVGNNSATYFNTASLVTCVQNFPRSRGPMVGILKGFLGLTSAILTQIYTVMHTTDQASLILMIAVGPTLVAIAMMFVMRPVGGHLQERPSDKNSFVFIYTICLLLASYLAGVKLVQDFLQLSHNVVVFLTVILFILLVSPIAIPVTLTLISKAENPIEEALLSESEPLIGEGNTSQDQPQAILSEVEDKSRDIDAALPPSERRNRRPYLGENFTMKEALGKADFWFIWLSFLLGSGSGLTVMDNLGQMSQAVGFKDVHIFVSLTSIWNFLGRVGGGYFSEIIVRQHAYPRHIALAVSQILIATAHFLFAMAWPGTMYIGTFLVGLGYGAHWAIVPAAVSELFGIKHFGAMYNFLALANPAGSFIFSGLITSTLYDYEAEKQAAHQHRQVMALASPRLLHSAGFFADGRPLKCEGSVCFFVSSLIMSLLCVIGAGLSLIIVHRTKRVYTHLYRERAYPRHIALAVAQILIATAHFLFAMAWPGTMYIGTFLVGLGYGAHWAIVPAAVSELFGLKHFGAIYNFLTLANPTGSLIFSGLITSTLYDYEAEKQAHQHQITALVSPRSLHSADFRADEPLKCEGAVCFFLSSLIMSLLCVIGSGLSLIVVHRTKRVYAHLYRPVLT